MLFYIENYSDSYQMMMSFLSLNLRLHVWYKQQLRIWLSFSLFDSLIHSRFYANVKFAKYSRLTLTRLFLRTDHIHQQVKQLNYKKFVPWRIRSQFESRACWKSIKARKIETRSCLNLKTEEKSYWNVKMIIKQPLQDHPDLLK